MGYISGTEGSGTREKIQPAMTPEQWSAARAQLSRLSEQAGNSATVALMAAANDGLSDADPRKITRTKLAELRTLIAIVENDRGRKCSEATAFVDALESFLPPIGFEVGHLDGHETRG